MTARTDLDNAFSILDAGITAHVAALKTSKAALADESYLTGMTAKVLAFADTLAASNQAPFSAVVPAAVVMSPSAQTPSQVPSVAPVAAPVAALVNPLHDPGATPAMIAAAIAAQQANVPAPTPAASADMMQKLEDAIKGMLPKAV